MVLSPGHSSRVDDVLQASDGLGESDLAIRWIFEVGGVRHDMLSNGDDTIQTRPKIVRDSCHRFDGSVDGDDPLLFGLELAQR